MNIMNQTHKLYISIAITFLLSLFVLSLKNAQGKSKIYWSENGKIRRANLNGTSVEDIAVFNTKPKDIAIDSQNGIIFWISPEGTTIQRANLDGTNIDIVMSNISSPCIAIDIKNKKIYWSPIINKGIYHANFDGSEITDIMKRKPKEDFLGINIVTNMEVDSNGKRIYWTGFLNQNIKRVKFDGTELKDIEMNAGIRPIGLALDVNNGHLYRSTNIGMIQRSSLNGWDVKTLISGLDYITDIKLDLHSQKIYWSSKNKQSMQSKIQRANLDGSKIKDILTGLEDVNSIALYIEELYDVTPDTNKLTTTWANIKTQ